MDNAVVLSKGLEVLPEWGTLGAFIVLVAGFLWYICKRDAAMERLIEKCFGVIEENTTQAVNLENSIVNLSKEVRDLQKK